MHNKIKHYLNQVQAEHNIEILLACETGSRAWGFPSPDSDFDVRFIFRHPKDWYLALNEKKDTIECMYENNEFDLSGWDLKKTLNLLWKSNASLLERLQSPIIYMANPEFLSGMQSLSLNAYSKIATMHHYLNMTKRIFEEINAAEQVKLKKLFYALRTSIACKWIIEKSSPPPIVFQDMLKDLSLPNNLKTKIYQLIELKLTKNESYLHFQETELNEFILDNIRLAEAEANSLPASKGDINELNSFFIKMLPH